MVWKNDNGKKPSRQLSLMQLAMDRDMIGVCLKDNVRNEEIRNQKGNKSNTHSEAEMEGDGPTESK